MNLQFEHHAERAICKALADELRPLINEDASLSTTQRRYIQSTIQFWSQKGLMPHLSDKDAVIMRIATFINTCHG